MAAEYYTKGEVDMSFENINLKLEALHNLTKEIKGETGEIKKDVKLTNGRVLELERWKMLITGGVATLSFIVAVILLPLILLFVGQWIVGGCSAFPDCLF